MAYAVLIDTMSIQRYVFSSNKLKENLGASYIVGNIYNELKQYIKEENGYVGGGKAFILFEKDPKEIIRDFTKQNLLKYPGVTFAVSQMDDFDSKDFKKSFDLLHEKLKESKNKLVPITILPSHGINAECPITGFSANVFLKLANDIDEEDANRYISSVSFSKWEASKKAKEHSDEILKNVGLHEKYIFTDKLDLLGQNKGEDSHIAVVHIDGNGMGDTFRELKSLSEIKDLSASVKESVREAFDEVLLFIDRNIKMLEKDISLVKDGGKKILPIRPIVMGGDDVTFVCDGRLGIILAKVFMEAFEKQKTESKIPLSSCAGIAIFKTKYPFYRAYEIAEQLCHNAKNVRKLKSDKGSWLDYHLSYGGISGHIDDIRDKHYRSADGHSLLMRPYRIDHLNGVFANVKEMDKIPNSKVKELREVLTMDKSRRINLIHQFKFRGVELPCRDLLKGENDLFSRNEETPFFDLIELSELLPKHLIQGGAL